MTLPNTFANETSPNMQELDENFIAVSNMAVWNTTATGTNTIALTTTANQPAVAAYTDRQRFQFVGPNNSSGSVTVAINSLAALPLYLITGVQAGSGDISSGIPYQIIYLAALNASAGGFQIVSATPGSVTAPTTNALLHGLTVTNNSGTPNTKIDMTASTSVLVSVGGTPKYLASVSVTIDLTTTGANGMDTGARPTSGWVYCYGINNGSVTAGLATATSPTVGLPTLPGGYTTYAYAGAMYCDGSQNLLRTKQLGNVATYVMVAASNTATTPILASGNLGTPSSTNPVLSAVTVTGNSGKVPLTASVISVVAFTNWKSLTNGSVQAAPSFVYSGSGAGPNGSLGMIWPVYSPGSQIGVFASMVLESASIGYAGTTTGSALGITNWTDFYSAGA